MSGHPYRDRLISNKEAARIWRVAPSTFRAYAARGYAPPAVAPGRWSEAEVREWRAERPGQGTRTDKWGE